MAVTSNLKRTLLGGVAAIALLAAIEEPASADVPVIDTAALGEWAQNLVTQAKQYATQIQQYITETKEYIGDELSWTTQLAQYARQGQQYITELQQFLAFVHNPSLGSAMGLLSMAGLTSGLPINPYAVLGLVNGIAYGQGGLPEISGILGSLSGLSTASWATNHVYTPQDQSWASQQIIARENGIAGAQGAAQTTYQSLQTHMAALQALRDHLASASTPKDVQDTQAQIELETTWTNNQAAQLQAVMSTYQAQSDAIVSRDNQRLDQDLEGFISTAPNPNP
jgi:hypothetical protein